MGGWHLEAPMARAGYLIMSQALSIAKLTSGELHEQRLQLDSECV